MSEREVVSATSALQHDPARAGGWSGERERGSLSLQWWNVAKRYGYWFTGSLLLFAYGLFTNVTSGLITNDESWFLQVVHRVTTGDVLYRDVFFGATPLSVYTTAAFVALFGTEILVVKVIMAACFALTCLLSCHVARQLGLGKAFSLLLVMTLLAYVPSWVPGAGSPYTPLAHVFLLTCFSAVLSWRDSAKAGTSVVKHKSTGALVIAGANAGLCFATKQSLGIYALLALWLAVAVSYRDTQMNGPRLIGAFLLVLAAFLLAAGLILLPVWLSGGTEKFLDYGFLNKDTYIRLAQIPYRTQLNGLVRLASSPASLEDLRDLYWQLQLLLPFPTFAALLWAWLRAGPGKRGLAAVMLILTGTAFADVFPRVSIHHTTSAIPALLLGLAWACRQIFSINARGMLFVRTIFLLWLELGVSYLLIHPVLWIVSGDYQFSPLPHLRGALVPVSFIEGVRTQAKALVDSTDGEQLFILNPSAGLYYLVTGLKNPTPFDYPLVTAFGQSGQAEVIAAIKQQRIPSVCLTPLGSDHLKPAMLESYVQDNMERSSDIGFCTLYRNRP